MYIIIGLKSRNIRRWEYTAAAAAAAMCARGELSSSMGG